MTQEELRLRRVIGRMTSLATAGKCQFSGAGKHAFLNDIVQLGLEEGFDILGIPEDPELRKQHFEDME